MKPAPRTSAAQRGFTLIELMISAAISLVLCAGALMLLGSQQRAFVSSADDRALQETARSALADVAANLRRAGYGVEPWLAFDFGAVANAPASWPGAASLVTTGYPGGVPGSSPPGCSPTVAVTDRDSISGSDEVVFYARDPSFSRQLAAAPTTTGTPTLTFPSTAPLTTPLYEGQILQVMCGGAARWAYVTVGAFADVGSTAVPLAATCTTGKFPHQVADLAASCFSVGFANARVFKVERFHYYVRRYDDGTAAGPRPYLMLDRGLWRSGSALVEPVAPDVEDLQFAYVFPRAATQLVGATTGTRLARAPGSIDLAAAPPAYTDLTSATSRTTNHPANLRAVRVSVVARSQAADDRHAAAEYARIPAAGNRPEVAGDAGYRRIVVETTEAIRNMDARGPYYPAYSANNGADGLNVGGG